MNLSQSFDCFFLGDKYTGPSSAERPSPVYCKYKMLCSSSSPLDNLYLGLVVFPFQNNLSLCFKKKARSTCQPSSLRESGFTAFLSRKKGKNVITLKSVDQRAEHIGPTKVPHSSHPAIMKQWPFSNNQRI